MTFSKFLEKGTNISNIISEARLPATAGTQPQKQLREDGIRKNPSCISAHDMACCIRFRGPGYL